MNFCQEIENAKCCYGKMATDYSVAATFGRGTDKKLFNLLRLNAYIQCLERNIPQTRKVFEKISLEGQKVSFSSLRRENNSLILDIEQTHVCRIIEISPCLSDTEICQIIESVKILCYECNCNI